MSVLRGMKVALLLVCAVMGRASADAPVIPPPADLPRYDLTIHLDTNTQTAKLTSKVTWTNRSTKPSRQLVFNFYPHYRVPSGDYLLLSKTLELLRLNPSYGIDRTGKHGQIQSVVLKSIKGRIVGDTALTFLYRHDNMTAFEVELPEEIHPGESVTIEMQCDYRLPNKQGRWGNWQGITTFVNSIPVLAYHNDSGWHAMPFVPWHQPFFNEAGIYTASVFVPKDQKLACSAVMKSERDDQVGWKEVRFEPFVGRDFALLSSAEYREFTSSVTVDGRTIQLKCLAFAKHEHYAKEMLKVVAEAIPTYTKWLGPFPYSQFTLAESFFGWNGNECGGLVMIDERIFDMPKLAYGYVEYLVSHETCHQWWYNLVGTNGYSETFMDEGAATYFSHRLMDVKHGKNNPMLQWPKGLDWLPNIGRDNYRNASMVGAIRRDEMPAAAGDMPGFNHLVGLFTGAYDRGSKFFGMIEARMGEEAFLEFSREIVRKYSWGMLSAATFRQELETFTGRPWGDFFEKWVYGKGMTDWSIVSVDADVNRTRPGPRMINMFAARNPIAPRRVAVVIKQSGAIEEPTILGIRPANSAEMIRIPIASTLQAQSFDDYGTKLIPLGDGRVRVEFTMNGEPDQIAIDPDHVLLDSNPTNNAWRYEPRMTVSPLYTMLNETDLTNDYDRWNLGAGPWIGGAIYPDPWYTRSTMIGLRAGAYQTQFYSGGIYAAVRSDYRDAVIGADGLFDHEPFAKTQMGYSVERRIGGPWFSNSGSDTATRASLFTRYVFQYGSSLYLPPIHYVESFGTYQDNFLPIVRPANADGDRPDHLWLSGLHYRLNLLTPYWDPEWGVWADATFAGGYADLPRQMDPPSHELVTQFRSELSAVKALPDCIPIFGSSRLVVRGVFASATPDRGQFFALGGSTLFRGFDLAERQGSMLWVANAEWRLPLARNVTWDALDHTAGVRNLWLAAFYDVGAIYTDGQRNGNVAHALGLGLRVDTAIFSFMERATLRLDVAKTVNANSPVQVWFGVQHPF
ncbi:MAG: M1 family aminopeptidase [Gemmataceae bacterium]